MNWTDKEYDVGFGRPPVSGQFQKGTSGNPKGRPKGTRNFATDLQEMLSSKVIVVENGEKKKISVQMATLKRLSEKALKGDPRLIALMLGFAGQLGSEKEALSTEKALSATDAQILQNYADSLVPRVALAIEEEKDNGNDN